MNNKAHASVRKITQLSLFLAMGIILNIIESMIPLPLPVPGVRLGLANTIGLVLLYYYGIKEYVSIGFLRVLIVALLRTGLFSMSFYLSFAGWALSCAVCVLFYLLRKFSIFGLSSISAVFHGIGQIIVVMIVYEAYGYILYLGILMVSGIISGLLTATIASLVLNKVDKHIRFIDYEENKKEDSLS